MNGEGSKAEEVRYIDITEEVVVLEDTDIIASIYPVKILRPTERER